MICAVSVHQAIKEMNAIFTSPTVGFGEAVYHIPGGVVANRTEVAAACVDWDAEEGRNEVRGDGRTVNQDRGRSVRQTVVIEVPVSVQVSEDGRDQFEVMDPVSESLVLVSVKRILGRDAGLQSVLATRITEHMAQAGRRLG